MANHVRPKVDELNGALSTTPPAERPSSGWWRSHRSSDPAQWSLLDERLQFLAAFIRNPAAVGSLWPSSPTLARATLSNCDLRSARLVVELGPGTGAFTRVILDRLGEQTEFFVIELDSNSTLQLRRRFPGLHVVNDSAENLTRHVEKTGKKADYIISGLPWANMNPELQDRILDNIIDSLAERGAFTTFGYWHASLLPASRRFRVRLEKRFGVVRRSHVIWKNVPPAIFYSCRHPRVAQD
ncbi:MAG: SAM-dependent methyltransferase [Verrucomicrobia bacterium]|nr:SAM-dependent methyltransferase [Verrucomicrobiota bacterium]